MPDVNKCPNCQRDCPNPGHCNSCGPHSNFADMLSVLSEPVSEDSSTPSPVPVSPVNTDSPTNAVSDVLTDMAAANGEPKLSEDQQAAKHAAEIVARGGLSERDVIKNWLVNVKSFTEEQAEKILQEANS